MFARRIGTIHETVGIIVVSVQDEVGTVAEMIFVAEAITTKKM